MNLKSLQHNEMFQKRMLICYAKPSDSCGVEASLSRIPLMLLSTQSLSLPGYYVIDKIRGAVRLVPSATFRMSYYRCLRGAL